MQDLKNRWISRVLVAIVALVVAGCSQPGGPGEGGGSPVSADVASDPESLAKIAAPSPERVVAAPAVPAPAAPAYIAPPTADARSAESIAIPPPASPLPEPQSGLLTAGDYDDVLNPDLYNAYLDKVLQGKDGRKDLPYVDAAQRIALRVTDRLGKPMPFADIRLETPQGQPMFPLRTGANGIVYLYPNFDALDSGMKVTVSANGATAQSRTLSATDLSTGGSLSFVMDRDTPQVSKLDVLLTLDATGSMADEMRFLQVELTAIMERLKRDNPGLDIRAGLIVYRDKRDDYVVRDFDFTGDLEAFNTSLAQQSAKGGGDFPEAMHTALQKGGDLSWREDAIKVNLLVADAPPHDEDIAATWESALHSRVKGVHIVPLAASGVDPTAEFMMRAMGQLTGGRYLFLTDDSGVGNPHAEPTVDCYVVTPLNGLVQRVLESLISGVRVEPNGSDVIRTVGSYQAGVCRI